MHLKGSFILQNADDRRTKDSFISLLLAGSLDPTE